MEKSINVKVFELHDSGVKAGKIAQKLRIKKTVVLDILGEAGKSGNKIQIMIMHHWYDVQYPVVRKKS